MLFDDRKREREKKAPNNGTYGPRTNAIPSRFPFPFLATIPNSHPRPPRPNHQPIKAHKSNGKSNNYSGETRISTTSSSVIPSIPPATFGVPIPG